ncbi:MAG: hypothetical protein HWN66_09860 [Candidatus Helarchaeota archaeon]|nr:hypothetical protein [Candidatus Helarchaeota archaeon]
MKILTVYYSRTGNTKGIGEEIVGELKCDVEEIFDTQKRKGIWGWLKSGYQATRKKLTVLQPINLDPSDFDLVIIGTPIWNRHVSVPTRTYLSETASKLKKVAFFCTEGGRGGKRAFSEMETVCDQEPVAVLELTKKDIKKSLYNNRMQEFIEIVQKG